MKTNQDIWQRLETDFLIATQGSWRNSAQMRPGRRLESQVFSSSSLVNVRSLGSFSIIRSGASIGAVGVGRFSAIGANFVCSPPEHPVDNLGTSSVFLKDYPWAAGNESGFYTVARSKSKLVTNLVTIGNDVWIGRDVYVRGGVTIGDGAIIAARAVVTRNVPPYTIVAGTPAKVLKARFRDRVVADLLDVKWWTRDPVWMQSVDFENVEECVEYLKSEGDSLPELQPHVITFREDDFTVEYPSGKEEA